MDYRTNAKAPTRTLSVRNHSIGTAIVFFLLTLVFVAAGVGMVIGSIMTDAAGLTRVIIFLAGLLFIAIGGVATWSTAKGLRARTRFAIEGEQLIVELFDGRRRELPLKSVVGAEVGEEAGDDATIHWTRIKLENGESVSFDDTKTSGDEHYRKTADAINRFLRDG